MRKMLLFAMATLLAAQVLLAEDQPARLQKGDRVVFLGDSITQAGAGPGGYVTLIAEQLKKDQADLGVEVIGAGISDNKVTDLQRRLESDVLSKKPTLVVIYIGINDVWHGENNPAGGTTPEKFTEGLKEIIGKIQSAGARVLLCTPSVIGEKKAGTNKLDSQLDKYSELSREVAKETKSPLCDLRKMFQEHLAEHNKEDKESGVLTSDRVHLNAEGNRFVADCMLRSLAEQKK